jgi:hypothetical protein
MIGVRFSCLAWLNFSLIIHVVWPMREWCIHAGVSKPSLGAQQWRTKLILGDWIARHQLRRWR